jgi:cytoskeletal protein RodZ
MALSMDEQRMLAEIERRLAAEDPSLAARLSSFKRPSPAVKLRSPRSKVIGSLFAVAAALALSMMIYAMIPFRAHAPRVAINPQATGGVSASAPAKPAQHSAGSSHTAATGKSGAAAKATTGKTAEATGTHAP